jgi:hypothetical protein
MVGSQPDGYWSWLIGCGLLVKIFNWVEFVIHLMRVLRGDFN